MEGTRQLAGKVIAITGAGRGIGREIAIHAASLGAKVVVNDLGTSGSGEGSADLSPAEEVVRAITQAGGEAVANGDSVAEAVGAKRIIDTAVERFGRIDCVVNNAGILRDQIFHKMSIEDFETVLRVHLLGSFYTSHAAAQHFKKQESGTFIHFTSTSGLIGNFGQANYMAAKLGIVGLSKAIALDMKKFNVRSNCIAPFAWTRLVGTIPTTTEAEKERVERVKQMTPEKIAPLVAYLASDLSSDVSGQIFGSRMNELMLFSQHRPVRLVHKDSWTIDSIAEHAMPALKPSFTPLERSGEVFCWDPI